MITVKSIVPSSAASKQLTLKLRETRKLFNDFDRQRNAVESLAIRLGGTLLELQTAYRAVYKTKYRFVPWAAEKFKRAEKTIQSYMRAARRPEQWKEAREKESQQKYHSPINRAKNAYMRLDEEEKIEFLLWLDTVLNKPRQIQKSKRYRQQQSEISLGESA